MNKYAIGLVMAGLICLGGQVVVGNAEEVNNNISIEMKETKALNGWVQDNYDWNYYKNGVMLKEQWLKENNKWYYFDWSGRMLNSGSEGIDNKWYLFDTSGAMIEKKGWAKLDTGSNYETGWYWGNGDGTIKVAQWIQVGGKWHYLDDGRSGMVGKMCSGESYYIDDKVYLFDNDGSMVQKKGWVKISGENFWYYGNGDGTVKTNQWIQNSKKWYFVDDYGVMNFGGASHINEKTYLFDNDGIMVEKKGWIKLSGKDFWYYGNGDGTVKTNQWIESSSKWYYLNEYGATLLSGTANIDGKWYIFADNGAMVKKEGWVTVSRNNMSYWYYGNGDGTAKTNQWISDSGKWYYLTDEGEMIHKGFENDYGWICEGEYEINGTIYKFDQNGVCLNP